MMKCKYVTVFSKLNPKKPYFNKVKPKKGGKYKRKERHDIAGVATRVKHQVLYVRVASIPNSRLDEKIDYKILVSYDDVI